MAKIIEFPKCIAPECTKCNPKECEHDFGKDRYLCSKCGAEGNDYAPVATVIHQGDQVVYMGPEGVAAGHVPFPYPSAPAVDPRYLKALKEQKERNA